MRDPRLVEIDFLMDLETKGMLTIQSTNSDAHSGVVGDGSRERYGLDARRFRDLLLELLSRGLIVGYRSQLTTYNFNPNDLTRERSELVMQLMSGDTTTVYPSHAGRVHLWGQRDALLRDPDIEPMGLRSQAAWARDLFLRLRWATKEAPLSIVFLDLDNFGAVNKELGHGVGDAVLIAAFGLIRNLVGTRGAAYRCGGEEVGVLLPDVPHDVAVELAKDLRAVIEREVRAQVPKLDRDQTASIGVSTFDAPVASEEAVARVDALMRTAKKAGKNRVHAG